MRYFDTDVLIHSLINQNTELHSKIVTLFKETVGEDLLTVSWLGLQETAFVLAKLNQQEEFITEKMQFLAALSPVAYDHAAFVRATELGKIIGFKNFNDCLHTAIAEQYCTDIYTCNYKDFKRIEPHTILNIHYL